MQLEQVQAYLKDALGVEAPISPWDGAEGLPFFLRDVYDFAVVTLFQTACVLVIVGKGGERTVDVRRDLDTVARQIPHNTLPIYVTASLASYERKRLITQGVPFIVPGNQMFLPHLGLDLREHFRKRHAMRAAALSPASQALLFAALLRPWEAEVHPERLNERFNYTRMTVSRAAGELNAAGLATSVAVGKEKWWRFQAGPAQVWKQAKPWLRSPVGKLAWAIGVEEAMEDTPQAGLSALADLSSLAEPRYPERAISTAQWQALTKRKLAVLTGPDPGAMRWQIWRYDPKALARAGRVDPLSLIASLDDTADERVQQALEQLEANLPW